MARQIWLEGVDFPLLLARQLITNEAGSIGTLYLVTSDLGAHLRPSDEALSKTVEHRGLSQIA
jgi:hypothetical protein